MSKRFQLNGEVLTSSDSSSRSFTYDSYYRLLTKTETTGSNTFTAAYSYDDYGNLTKEILNNAITIDYLYNQYGYNNEIKVNDTTVWEATSMNRYGQIDDYTLGNGINTVISYDQNGLTDKIETKLGSSWIQNWDYDFDPVTGNMEKRTGLKSGGSLEEEEFTYDDLNRLRTYTVGNDTYENTYDQSGTGNITAKSDVGSYIYSPGFVHSPDSISNLMLTGDLPEQSVTYTKFNKISTLTHTGESFTKKLSVVYGPDEDRVKTVYTEDGDVKKVKYFALGSFEKEIIPDSITRELYYITSPTGLSAIVVKTGAWLKYYYIHTDILGSFDVITDSSGAVVERLSFDPWGRRRNPADWSYDNVPVAYKFDRGFTGHEHLDEFGLINMNGRVYDPLLAMFLSPDSYVQNPEHTQNFNRYSYAYCSPLIYTDPDGEFPWLITILNAVQNYQYAKNSGLSTWGAIAYTGTNLIFNIGSSFLNLPGIIPNGLIHAGMNFVGNGISNRILDRPFLNNWAFTTGSGFASGSFSGYQSSKAGGLNYWWGSNGKIGHIDHP